MKNFFLMWCVCFVLVCCGCSDREENRKRLLEPFVLPSSLQIEILPNSAGFKSKINYKKFLHIKSNLKGYSPWYKLDKTSVVETEGICFSGEKGTYTYSVGAWAGGYRKVLIYDKKNHILYALFATGIM